MAAAADPPPRRSPRIEASWAEALADEFAAPYMAELSGFLRARRAAGATIFPPPDRIFAAFDAAPIGAVRVVIMGQDPYHGHGQACGLSFAVPRGIRIPPSLVNVYRELHDDLGIAPASHGDLSGWARQGVLLLNATLTVEEGQPGSHHGRGWERFTDAVLRTLSAREDPIVFLLWGRNAQARGEQVDASRHFVLEAAHPSPHSARNGFFGCRHFSATNQLLESAGRGAIEWTLDP